MTPRDGEGMQRIGAPLQDLLDRLRLREPMRGWKAVELWPEVAGERIAARARAVGFRDGVLVVSVDNAAWMNELAYLRHRIVQELNRRLGEGIVTDIRLQPARGERTGPEPGRSRP